VNSTPLDDYVWKDDGMFNYTVLHDWTYKSPSGRTSYLLNMTSQRWLTGKCSHNSGFIYRNAHFEKIYFSIAKLFFFLLKIFNFY